MNTMDNFSPRKEDFRFADKNKHLPEVKNQDKPERTWKKILKSFFKHPATIVGGVLITLILLLAFIPPLASGHKVSDNDTHYAYKLPKADAFEGSGFWDGTYKKKANEKMYYSLIGIGAAANDTSGTSFDQNNYTTNKYNPVKKVGKAYLKDNTYYRDITLDCYYEVGFAYDLITEDIYQKIVEYESKSGLKVLYPMVDTNHQYCEDVNDANIFYFSNGLYPCDSSGKFIDVNTGAILDNPKQQSLKIIPNYLKDSSDSYVYYVQRQGSLQVRVLYYNYYQFRHWAEHGGSYFHSPSHLFGSDAQGFDILVRTSSGVRISLSLALTVFIINFIIGTIYGILEGYYGGKVDFIMYHITGFLAAIPFIIIATLFYQYFVYRGSASVFVGLLITFCFAGWIPYASQTRRQIYRFKSREYVFASRLLGANDFRLISRHIYPNAIGTLITSFVLTIPAIIFQESGLSFLGIVNFNGTKYTSLGTLIANGQNTLGSYPHMILLPILALSILMIAFNLIGNGLRDAFQIDRKGKKK